ncbi:calcium-binding protein P isoform X2 [Contarinia nasturtii]|uniref:calcium-binding protein P isoform X2 n=1 Tax=Contarinia nasturtii TaxID=265458 RepID=UPI0012D43CF4|nr:calcium-binding protein P isoform X2 [Contarinia nasturtii]
MVPLVVLSIMAALLSTGVECGQSSASSSSSSNSDGTGHTYTHTGNNGQGTYTTSQQKPGGGSFTQTGNYPHNPNHQYNPSYPNNPSYYGPSNFGQPGFGFGTYGPGYPYGQYGLNPQYSPFPQQNFGFGAPFQPLPFQQVQPMQPFAPFQPLATPHEYTQYLNGLQQQYAAYYKQQQDYLNALKNSAYQPGYAGPNYAYATGAYNPNTGYHQTAGVHPPNKNKPNVETRFDSGENLGGNVPPAGYFGIQTSSFSSSSDLNGIKKHKEGALTTINDNGQVSTYSVEN